MVPIGSWGFDCWEGERVRDFEDGFGVHANKKAGRRCRKRLRTMFDDLHHHLFMVSIPSLQVDLLCQHLECLPAPPLGRLSAVLLSCIRSALEILRKHGWSLTEGPPCCLVCFQGVKVGSFRL